MRLIKLTSSVDEDGYADKTVADHRHLKLHGSTNKRGMAKAGGNLQRLGEKPRGGRGKR